MHEMSLILTHLSPTVVQTSPDFYFSLLPINSGRVSQEQSRGGKNSSFAYSLKKYSIKEDYEN